MARPTDYNEEIADLICERIALGESVRKICSSDDTPSMSTVFKWLNEHKEFSEQYARAREEQAESLADEIVSIADESELDVKANGDVVFDATAVARNRLRIDARKWVASKLKPKKYGDKLDVEHSGETVSNVTVRFVSSDE